MTVVLCAVLINFGVWLMGEYGLEVRVGTQAYGGYVDIVHGETPMTWYIGLLIAAASTVALLITLYKNRQHR